MTTKSLSALIGDLRLVEREDCGSTRESGSARAEALTAEIGERLKAIEAVVEDQYGNVALNEAFYGKES